MATKEKKGGVESAPKAGKGAGKKKGDAPKARGPHAGAGKPVAPPRLRDFRGVSTKSFDGRGNYSLGVKEQLIFPEINYDTIDSTHGMDITFVTTAPGDDLALALLKELGMPFRGNDKT